MNIQDILNYLGQLSNNQDILVKIALILVLLLFTLFTLVLARQISVLTHLIYQVNFSSVLQGLAYALTFLSILLIVIVIFV